MSSPTCSSGQYTLRASFTSGSATARDTKLVDVSLTKQKNSIQATSTPSSTESKHHLRNSALPRHVPPVTPISDPDDQDRNISTDTSHGKEVDGKEVDGMEVREIAVHDKELPPRELSTPSARPDAERDASSSDATYMPEPLHPSQEQTSHTDRLANVTQRQSATEAIRPTPTIGRPDIIPDDVAQPQSSYFTRDICNWARDYAQQVTDWADDHARDVAGWAQDRRQKVTDWKNGVVQECHEKEREFAARVQNEFGVEISSESLATSLSHSSNMADVVKKNSASPSGNKPAKIPSMASRLLPAISQNHKQSNAPLETPKSTKATSEYGALTSSTTLPGYKTATTGESLPEVAVSDSRALRAGPIPSRASHNRNARMDKPQPPITPSDLVAPWNRKLQLESATRDSNVVENISSVAAPSRKRPGATEGSDQRKKSKTVPMTTLAEDEEDFV